MSQITTNYNGGNNGDEGEGPAGTQLTRPDVTALLAETDQTLAQTQPPVRRGCGCWGD